MRTGEPGPSGWLTGLDYSGVRAIVAGLGLKWREVMPKLMVMEDEVLKWQSKNSRQVSGHRRKHQQ